MKKILLAIAVLTFTTAVSAQTVLSLESHGLLPGEKNDMKLTEWVAPGQGGSNAIWDFTKLELKKDFLGTLDDAIYSKSSQTFSEANTVLEEFGNYFYFDVNQQGIKLHGFETGSGVTKIRYDEPFVKIQYPFSYKNSFSGDYTGTYFRNNDAIGTLQGTYSVEGDGQGTLLLPGNVQYKDALRVKEVKSYTQTLNSRSTDIVNTTYRWYTQGHRFPILVLIESTYTYPSGQTNKTTQAAYNPVIIADAQNLLSVDSFTSNLGINAYPNPYRDHVSIRFTLQSESKTELSVFDLNGRKVATLINSTLSAGEQVHTFSAKEMGLANGAYLVKLNANGNETTLRLIEQ